MFKSTESCRGENCDCLFIQNKKYHLCSNCVYKKNHGGKSQQEVQVEKQNKKMVQFGDKLVGIPSSFEIVKGGFKPLTEEELQFQVNKQAQDNITETDEGERRFIEQLKKENTKSEIEELSSCFKLDPISTRDLNKLQVIDLYGKKIPKSAFTKKQKPIKQLSVKQAQIEREYKKTCIDMDYTEEKVCSGCNRFQGGDIRLSHSHIISRADCKGIGRPELISLRENLTYHCMTFAGNKGCHSKWENPKERKTLLDYEKNINFIKSISEEMYNKYKVD